MTIGGTFGGGGNLAFSDPMTKVIRSMTIGNGAHDTSVVLFQAPD